MKKISYILLAFLSAALFSCTKEFDPNNASAAAPEEGTKVILHVNDAVVGEDGESKTAYTSGTGIAIQGTENLKMFYATEEMSDKEGVSKLVAGVLAEPTGTAGEYSFTVPAAAAKATWYGVLPYSTGSFVVANNSGGSLLLRLGPVQFPKANSFDPQADVLIGEGFDLDVTAGAQSATITTFKRMFAPLRIRVKGLPEGEKIYAFNIKSSQDPTKNNALNGLNYVQCSKDFDKSKSSSIGTDSNGNAMSAVYDGGLSSIGSEWPVWLVVCPATLKAASTLTFTVSTDSKTYTKTVTLSKDLVFKAYTNTINDISVDMSSDVTSTQSSTYVFLNNKDNGWAMTNASWYTDTDSEFPAKVLRFSNAAGGSFTFPEIVGKNIVGARIYSHPQNRANSGSTVTLTVDGTTYNYNLATTTALGAGTALNGGYVDIALPSGKTSLSGLTVTAAATQQHIISAITLELENADVDPNDYYAKFLAGEDIVINGEVYNSTLYPVAPRLVKAYEMLNPNQLTYDATEEGILFLDYNAADEKTDSYTSEANVYPTGTTIIIGRYKNHQPLIDVKSFAPYGTKLVLKNVELTTSSNMFVTSKCTSDLSVSIEDCTLNGKYYFIFSECNKGYCFEEIKISNSILNATRGLIGWTTTYATNDTINTGLISMTNSVFYGKSLVNYPTVAFKTSSTSYVATPNLDVNFDHCTIYNINNINYGIYALVNAKKINYNYNVSEAALTKASPIAIVPAALDPKITESTINYNYGNNSASNTFKWSHGYSAITSSGVTQTGNTWTIGATPFTSTDVTTGYFPINTSVVTNGAGASYDTKLWKTWTTSE